MEPFDWASLVAPPPAWNEGAFRSWYGDWARRTGINPDPDDPKHFYDYRAAFTAGEEPEISPEDGKYHWTSKYKDDDHPNRFVDGVDTKTGQADYASMVEPPDASAVDFASMVEPPEENPPELEDTFYPRWVGSTLERLSSLPSRVARNWRNTPKSESLAMADGTQEHVPLSVPQQLANFAGGKQIEPKWQDRIDPFDAYTEERYGQSRIAYEAAKERFLEAGFEEGRVGQALRAATLAGIDFSGLAVQQVTIDALLALPLWPLHLGGPAGVSAFSGAGGGIQAEIEGDMSVGAGAALGATLGPAPLLANAGARALARAPWASMGMRNAAEKLSTPLGKLFGGGDQAEAAAHAAAGDAGDFQGAVVDDLVKGRIDETEAQSHLEGLMDRMVRERTGFEAEGQFLRPRTEPLAPRGDLLTDVARPDVRQQGLVELAQQKARPAPVEVALAKEAILAAPQERWVSTQQAVDATNVGRGTGDVRLARRASVMARELGLSEPNRIFEDMISPDRHQNKKFSAEAGDILKWAGEDGDIGAVSESIAKDLEFAFSPEQIVDAEAKAASFIHDYKIMGEVRDAMIADPHTGKLARMADEMQVRLETSHANQELMGGPTASEGFVSKNAPAPLPDIGPEMGVVGAGVRLLQPAETIASRVDPNVAPSSPLAQWAKKLQVGLRRGFESASAEGHGAFEVPGAKPTFLQRITGQRPGQVLREELAEGARQPGFSRKAAAERARLVLSDFTEEMGRFIKANKNADLATEPEILAYMADYLEARNDGGAFTPKLRSLVDNMRADIAAGSARLQELLPESMRDLRAEISRNEGEYLHRPMQLFNAGQEELRATLAENWQVVENYVDFLERVHSSQQMPGTASHGLSPIPREELMAEAVSNLYIDPAPVTGKHAGATDILKRRTSLWAVKGQGPDEHLFLNSKKAEEFAGKLAEKTGHDATIQRRVMPQEFDDFYGLEPDARTRVLLTVGKQAQMAASIEYLNGVKGLGAGSFLSETRTPVHNTQVGGPKWSPIRDLYASPEEAAVLREFGEFAGGGVGDKIIEVLESVAAAPRRWRTVLNFPQTHIRNAAGYFEMLASNGKMSGALRIPRATAVVMEGRVGPTRVGGPARRASAKAADTVAGWIEGADGRPMFKSLKLDTVEDRRWFAELGIEVGIFREGALTGDILTQRRAAKRAKLSKPAQGASDVKEGIIRTLESWYIDEDDIGRGVGWMAEINDYARALGLDTTKREGLETAARLTAPLVRDVYPTMTKTPNYVEVLRRVPFVSDFPAFHSEMLRTSKNIPRQAIREIWDQSYREGMGATTPQHHAAIKRIGARRMAGFVMTNTVGRRTLRSVLRYNAQTDEDHEELARMLGPSFWEHSDLVVVGKNGKTWRVLDGSYSNPRQWAPEVFHAAMQKGNPFDVRVLETAEQLFEPFHSMTMAAESVFYLARGETKRNERLWVPGYPTTRNIGRVTSIAAPLAPGILQTPAKVAGAATEGKNPFTGYPLTLRDELVAQGVIQPFTEDSRLPLKLDPSGFMMGSRVLTLDIEEAFQAKLADFTDSVQEANRNLARDLRRTSNVTERFAAKSAASGASTVAWERLGRIVNQLVEVGFDYDDLLEWRSGRIGKAKLDALMAGDPPPVDLSPWPDEDDF